MSGASACVICGDIYYDPPEGDGHDCRYGEGSELIPSPYPSQRYMMVPIARYEATERVVEAAREWKATTDAFAAVVEEDDANWTTRATAAHKERDQAEDALTDALAAYDAEAAS